MSLNVNFAEYFELLPKLPYCVCVCVCAFATVVRKSRISKPGENRMFTERLLKCSADVLFQL